MIDGLGLSAHSDSDWSQSPVSGRSEQSGSARRISFESCDDSQGGHDSGFKHPDIEHTSTRAFYSDRQPDTIALATLRQLAQHDADARKAFRNSLLPAEFVEMLHHELLTEPPVFPADIQELYESELRAEQLHASSHGQAIVPSEPHPAELYRHIHAPSQATISEVVELAQKQFQPELIALATALPGRQVRNILAHRHDGPLKRALPLPSFFNTTPEVRQMATNLHAELRDVDLTSQISGVPVSRLQTILGLKTRSARSVRMRRDLAPAAVVTTEKLVSPDSSESLRSLKSNVSSRSWANMCVLEHEDADVPETIHRVG